MAMSRRAFMRGLGQGSLLVAGSLSAVALGGCSPQAQASTLVLEDDDALEKRYLSVLCEGDDAHRHGAFEQVAAGYTASNRDTKVIYDTIDIELYDIALGRRLSTDNLDDIFAVDNTLASRLLAEKRMEVVSDIVDAMGVGPVVGSHAQIVPGLFHVVPTCLDPHLLMVDTDLLEARGLAVPTTQDEFVDCCVALTRGGQAPVAPLFSTVRALAFGMVAGLGWWEVFQRRDHGDALAQIAQDPRAVARQLQAGLDCLARLVNVGAVLGPELLEARFSQGDPMAGGERAFCLAPLWMASVLREGAGSHTITCHPAPLAEEGSLVPLELVGCLAVDPKGHDLGGVHDFLRYLRHEDVLASYAANQRRLPAVPCEGWAVEGWSATCNARVAQGALTIANSFLLRETYDDALIAATETVLDGQGASAAREVFITRYGGE